MAKLSDVLKDSVDLNKLKAVDLSTPTDGQVLTYDSTAQEWQNKTPNSGVQLGETSSTAYRGDRGATAYSHSQLTSGNPHNVTKSNVGLGNVTNDAQLKASALDTNASLGSDDTKVPSQKAVKTYVDNTVANSGASAGFELITDGVSKWDIVAVNNSSKLIKADSSDDTAPAVGFVDSAYYSNATADVLVAGICEGQSGLTVGQPVYLGTSGKATSDAPDGSGEIVQRIGIAVNPTSFVFVPNVDYTIID